MLESQDRTADQRLTEFITEIGCAVRSFDQDLFRSLIQPRTRIKYFLPFTGTFRTRISRHINSSSGNRQRSLTTAQTVADFTTRTRCRSVERFYGCREVMCFRFQRDHSLDVFNCEIIRFVAALRSKLFYDRTIVEGHIIFISRYQFIRVLG